MYRFIEFLSLTMIPFPYLLVTLEYQCVPEVAGDRRDAIALKPPRADVPPVGN